MHHAKAKEEPKRRFHGLCDKVWREDFLMEAWVQVRRNGGSAGVDGERFKDIEAYGVEGWLGELARDLREGTYRTETGASGADPEETVLASSGLWAFPAYGTGWRRVRRLLVLEPIFEADLQPEQYGYRPGRSANDAVKRVHGLLQRGYKEVVDGDLSNYFGEIPHAELMKSIARRVSDGRMLRLIKAWLEMPVEEDDGEGGKRRRNRGRKQRKGTPQGAPISPLLSNLYMRRFILGWKVLGYARRFCAEIVNYADDFCVLGKAAAAEMLEAVKRIMEELKLPVNERKTRCFRCPEEALEFLGYRIGRNYRRRGRGSYIGTRPSQASVGSICRKISEWTAPRNGVVLPGQMVEHLNRVMTGWANYYGLGQVSPACRAIDCHAVRRLRQWLCRRHKVRSGGKVRFPDERLRQQYGLTCLVSRTKSFPWAKA